MNPMTDEHYMMAVIYMIGSFLNVLSLVLYYTKKADTIYYLIIYSILRNGIRLFDIEKTRDLIKDEDWVSVGVNQCFVMLVYIIYFAKTFPMTKLHIFNVLLMTYYLAFASICSTTRLNKPISIATIK